MIQLARAIIISLLAGVFVSGLFWICWDLVRKVQELRAAWRHESTLRKDAESLLDQAKDKSS